MCASEIKQIWKGWTVIFKRLSYVQQAQMDFLNLLDKSEAGQQLYSGENVLLDKKQINEIVKLFCKDKATRGFLAGLSAGIEYGKKQSAWECPDFQEPRSSKRKIPKFAKANEDAIYIVEKIEDHFFNNSIMPANQLSYEAQQGRLILSLIITCGIYDLKQLLQVLKVIPNKLVRARSLSYVSLGCSSKNRVFRMLLSDWSELLALSLSDECLSDFPSGEIKVYKSLIKLFLETKYEDWIPNKLEDLILVMSESASHKFSFDCVDYAEGKLITTHLKNNSFYRLMRVHALKEDSREIKATSCKLDVNIKLEQINAGSPIYEIKEAFQLKSKKETLKKLDELKRDFVKNQQENLLIFVGCIFSQITDSKKNWKPTKQKILNVTMRFFQLLYGTLEEQQIGGKKLNSSGEMLLIYQLIIDVQDSHFEKKLIAQQCYSFNCFLVENISFTHVAKTNNIFSKYLLDTVDANIITFSELRKACVDLRQYPNVELASIVEEIMLIGFYSGARSSESRGVSRVDFEADIENVFIQENEFRGLKTNNAKRVIPLKTYMVKDDLNLFKKRLTEVSKINTQEDLSFFGNIIDEYKSEPNRKKISALLHSTLRDICGDEEVRYYTLRHSAMSWLMLKLIWPKDYDFGWLDLDEESASFMGGATELRREQQGLSNRPEVEPQYRPSVYYLYRNQGHGSPITSYQHYMHFWDLIWFANLRQYYGVPNNKQIADLTGYRERTVREADNRGQLADFLDKYRKKMSARINVLPLYEQKDINNIGCSSLIEWLRVCLSMVEQNKRYGVSLDDLSERFCLPIGYVEKIFTRYDELRENSFVERKVLKRCFSPIGDQIYLIRSPKGGREKQLFEFLIQLLEAQITSNSSTFISQLDQLINNTSWRKNGPKFTCEDEANNYLKWLLELGLTLNDIKFIHYHGNVSKSIAKKQKNLWMLAINQPKVSALQERISTTRPINPKGNLGILVISKASNDESLESSYVFKLALWMIYNFSEGYLESKN